MTPRRTRTLRQQEARAGLALLSPTLVVVLAVVVLPILVEGLTSGAEKG